MVPLVVLCVIIPDPRLRVDEVGIPYQAFRVLFKYRIIYWIMVLDDVPLAKAYYRWSDAFKFDQHVYDIMNYIIEKEVPMILLNRNPTLNLYSLLRLKIRYIKRPERKETLSLPLGILEGLNADFDYENSRIKTSLIAGNFHQGTDEHVEELLCAG